jgi:hypothetical protein
VCAKFFNDAKAPIRLNPVHRKKGPKLLNGRVPAAPQPVQATAGEIPVKTAVYQALEQFLSRLPAVASLRSSVFEIGVIALNSDAEPYCEKALMLGKARLVTGSGRLPTSPAV